MSVTEFIPAGHTSTRYTAEDFDGSHAAPLLLYGPQQSEWLLERQDELSHNLMGATQEILEGRVKPNAVRFTQMAIYNRMKAREGLNSIHFAQRTFKYPNHHLVPGMDALDIDWAAYQARIGNGTIEQNDVAGVAYGTDSSELFNITSIGDFRAEEADDAFERMAAYLGNDVRPRTIEDYTNVKVLEYERDITNNRHISAIRIGAKALLGVSPYGSLVKLRSSFVIDTSPSSGFSEKTIDILRASQRSGFQLSPRAIKWLLELEMPTWTELASNHTAYADRTGTKKEN